MTMSQSHLPTEHQKTPPQSGEPGPPQWQSLDGEEQPRKSQEAGTSEARTRAGRLGRTRWIGGRVGVSGQKEEARVDQAQGWGGSGTRLGGPGIRKQWFRGKPGPAGGQGKQGAGS